MNILFIWLKPFSLSHVLLDIIEREGLRPLLQPTTRAKQDIFA